MNKPETLKMANVAIVTPVYKAFNQQLPGEIQSLLQLKTILGNRDIFFIHPSYVNVTEYIELFQPLNVRSILIDDKYFGNPVRGNRLFVQYKFYSKFSDYDFMLIYHTDAYVFSDQLDYWCSLNFDYIGAPWFVGNSEPAKPLQFKGVGNGGFSLRKLSSFIEISGNKRIIRNYLFMYTLYQFLQGNNYNLLRKTLGINYLMKIIKPHMGYEDEFWGLIVPRYFKWFNVARPEEALRFSFEVLPEELLKLNNNELPFGCHAWEKYDPSFWKKFIDVNINSLQAVWQTV
ncbi:DUF5672 family protein [Pararcticibacter amylolyticus]|uniref:DUF5672 domain-containing protein n=1 Tax=Pararcticibacter amylolyticus TaxID=2173175 RepID=A0A2U2PCH6_9SPHI|nr:DUF5672 family protein [Pararcticibacter amylolyticus]PWG78809.1 hypothetical protein DDR33_20505 [Pararcticibacter amylolyticus]